ncbi:hypothetical protein HZS56_00805 [Streptomyces sp. A108]|nr:hypothetical protein [Streptomyces sp. A108]
MAEEFLCVMTCLFGLFQRGGEGAPTGLAANGVDVFGQGLLDGACIAVSLGRGELTTTFPHHGHGRGGGNAAGGAEMLGGLTGGGGLLGVAAGRMPAHRGDGGEDQSGQEHRGGAAVFALSEGVARVDDAACGCAQGSMVRVFGADVGAGCSFEGAGGFGEFLARWGGCRLGDGVQERADSDEVCRPAGALLAGELSDGLLNDRRSNMASMCWTVDEVRCRGQVLFTHTVLQPSADLRQREVGRETRAWEPDRLSHAIAVTWQRDLVAEGITGRRVANFEAESGLCKAIEKLGFVRGSSECLADAFAESLSSRFGAAGSFGLGTFSAGGPLGSSAVALVEILQAPVLLDLAAFRLSPDAVLVTPWATAVFALERGDDVDVVLGVADGDPPAGFVVAVLGDAGGVDDAAGDFGPLVVAEVPVPGSGADGAVPDVPGRTPIFTYCEDRKVQRVGELFQCGS